MRPSIDTIWGAWVQFFLAALILAAVLAGLLASCGCSPIPDMRW